MNLTTNHKIKVQAKSKAAKAIYFFAVILLIGFWSCERDIEEPEGPSIEDLFGEFSVLQEFAIDNKTIDLAAGESTFFTAQFSKTVDWQIVIEGQQTGGIKVIEGTSNFIDASNSIWNGTTTQIPMFSSEMCDVELIISNENTSFADELEVQNNIQHEGYVVADFEDGVNPNWTGFVQAGGDMSFFITDDRPAGQGNSYYDMGGLVDWDYLIGLIDFPADAYGAETFDLNPNGEQLYFNVFLYNDPLIMNEIVLFQFREDDNGDGNFTESNEDLYAFELTDLEPGWQHISVKYSDLANLVNGQPSQPNGNGVHNPDKLHKISVLMLADPATGYSQVLMDYLIFTENAPLQP